MSSDERRIVIADALRGYRSLTVEEAIAETAHEWGVPLVELRSASRRPEAVKARRSVMSLLETNGFSIGEIATLLERSHQTVCYHLGRA